MASVGLDLNNELSCEMFQETTKILVVDDEDSVGRLVCSKLGNQGCKYAQVASAKEARSLIRTQDFDLFLCDMRMSGESGIPGEKGLEKDSFQAGFITASQEECC